MKKYINILILGSLLAAFTACHEPEYYVPEDEEGTEVENVLGIESLTAIMTTGNYVDKELATCTYSDPEQTEYVISIPWYYPETSDDETEYYLMALRVRAKLQANWSISPALGLLDLSGGEKHKFTLTGPEGKTREITISAERRRSSTAELVTLNITDYMVSGIINKNKKTVLIPSYEDLSAVSVTAQVSPHSTLVSIGGKEYDPAAKSRKYNLSDDSKIVVRADDGTLVSYPVSHGDPELVDFGFNSESVEQLFNIDPVANLGFPAYTENVYVSLAGQGNYIVACFGSDKAPVLVNKYNGSKAGTLNTGSAVVDVIASDEKDHIIMANFANKGEDVNIYRSDDVTLAPTLYYSFKDTLDVPVGHRMKVIGDIDGDAAIVFTSEGIVDVTTSSRAIYLKVRGGAVQDEPVVVDFSAQGLAWGPAPVKHATVVAASTNPETDGWFVDYYDNNADASIADNDSNADAYQLHYVNAKGVDAVVDHNGNWACNPNCLDSKKFNKNTYMALFVVSHFPEWSVSSRLYLYDISDPSSPAKVLENTDIPLGQSGATNTESGASGDVVICPASDGFRVFIYYYDHHTQSLGAYVADCIKM